MESGYNILWTDHALEELAKTYEYLELYFSEREMHRLSVELEKVLMLISRNPKLFPKSEFKEVRRAVIKKFNILYYRENDNRIEIISFFSNRQDPDKREI